MNADEVVRACDRRNIPVVLINGRPNTRQPLDADWIRSRFPPDGQT